MPCDAIAVTVMELEDHVQQLLQQLDTDARETIVETIKTRLGQLLHVFPRVFSTGRDIGLPRLGTVSFGDKVYVRGTGGSQAKQKQVEEAVQQVLRETATAWMAAQISANLQQNGFRVRDMAHLPTASAVTWSMMHQGREVTGLVLINHQGQMEVRITSGTYTVGSDFIGRILGKAMPAGTRFTAAPVIERHSSRPQAEWVPAHHHRGIQEEIEHSKKHIQKGMRVVRRPQ